MGLLGMQTLLLILEMLPFLGIGLILAYGVGRSMEKASTIHSHWKTMETTREKLGTLELQIIQVMQQTAAVPQTICSTTCGTSQRKFSQLLEFLTRGNMLFGCLLMPVTSTSHKSLRYITSSLFLTHT